MRSIHGDRLGDLLDAFDAAHNRFLASSFDALTAAELVVLLQRYAFLMGRLDALRYELASPFAGPRTSASNLGGRRG
jgi:hypothetical protein